mgnify:CR=1 FL=1
MCIRDRLKSGQWKGLPRAYVIAREMVSLSGGLLGEENILLMLRAYQDAAPLTDRELQVLPEMLGLALLERMENGVADGRRVFEIPYEIIERQST